MIFLFYVMMLIGILVAPFLERLWVWPRLVVYDCVRWGSVATASCARVFKKHRWNSVKPERYTIDSEPRDEYLTSFSIDFSTCFIMWKAAFLALCLLLAGVRAIDGPSYGVKLCGREFIRAVIFTCGGSRWRRSITNTGRKKNLTHETSSVAMCVSIHDVRRSTIGIRSLQV